MSVEIKKIDRLGLVQESLMKWEYSIKLIN